MSGCKAQTLCYYVDDSKNNYHVVSVQLSSRNDYKAIGIITSFMSKLLPSVAIEDGYLKDNLFWICHSCCVDSVPLVALSMIVWLRCSYLFWEFWCDLICHNSVMSSSYAELISDVVAATSSDQSVKLTARAEMTLDALIKHTMSISDSYAQFTALGFNSDPSSSFGPSLFNSSCCYGANSKLAEMTTGEP